MIMLLCCGQALAFDPDIFPADSAVLSKNPYFKNGYNFTASGYGEYDGCSFSALTTGTADEPVYGISCSVIEENYDLKIEGFKVEAKAYYNLARDIDDNIHVLRASVDIKSMLVSQQLPYELDAIEHTLFFPAQTERGSSVFLGVVSDVDGANIKIKRTFRLDATNSA